MSSAVATKPKTVTEFLRDGNEYDLADVKAEYEAGEIGRAWAAGEIEFGHRRYCVTGPVGKPGSAVVIEDGVDWSGPKTRAHKPYMRFDPSDSLPVCESYKRADLSRVKVAHAMTGQETMVMPTVTRKEALDLVGAFVRCTDAGLAKANA